MKNASTTAQAKTYRLPSTTTPESLEMRFSNMDGKTLAFGNYTLVTGYYFSGMNENSYFAAIYAFTTDDHTCEGEVRLVKVSNDRFADDGHAIAWAISEAK